MIWAGPQPLVPDPVLGPPEPKSATLASEDHRLVTGRGARQEGDAVARGVPFGFSGRVEAATGIEPEPKPEGVAYLCQDCQVLGAGWHCWCCGGNNLVVGKVYYGLTNNDLDARDCVDELRASLSEPPSWRSTGLDEA